MSAASRAREAAQKAPPLPPEKQIVVDAMLEHKAKPVLAMPIHKGQILRRLR